MLTNWKRTKPNNNNNINDDIIVDDNNNKSYFSFFDIPKVGNRMYAKPNRSRFK